MKKLTLIIATILCSCGYSAPNNTKYIIISDIESARHFENGIFYEGCYYYVKGTTSTRMEDKGFFYDRCGKFTVGDTIYISKRY